MWQTSLMVTTEERFTNNQSQQLLVLTSTVTVCGTTFSVCQQKSFEDVPLGSFCTLLLYFLASYKENWHQSAVTQMLWIKDPLGFGHSRVRDAAGSGRRNAPACSRGLWESTVKVLLNKVRTERAWAVLFCSCTSTQQHTPQVQTSAQNQHMGLHVSPSLSFSF